MPTPMSTYIIVTNRYVGAAKIVPDSRMPRRLARVMSTTAPIDSGTVSGSQSGTIEVSAATPAATDTETVRM